ncbi:nickel pincer cofactor biosynthesis protein LarC [Lachnospiraceae bacterium 62-35]
MERILYLECNSGISGDMTAGALLDLGADKDRLIRALHSLPEKGYRLRLGRKLKCGIDAYDFDVFLEEPEKHEHTHSHEHSGSSGHGQEQTHSHGHFHRNLKDIREIIDKMEEKDSVKEMAKRMFSIVANAEAKAHGIPVDEVHFHEVGAIDSIVDIVSAAVLIDDLKVDKVIVSPLAEGHGYVRCQHGVIPVPVPATANITEAYGISLRPSDNEGEMVTPTGAAIAAAYHCGEALPSEYCIRKIGIGAGNKDFKNANILRAMLIEEVKQEKRLDEEDKKDAMWVLETNIDDSTGEALGFAMEQLIEGGAADVWYVPAFMKKNRPAYVLHVLCQRAMIEEMEDIIFSTTTTIGIRRYPVERTILERKKGTVTTRYGEASVKLCFYKGSMSCYPEHESVKEICKIHPVSYQEAYCLIEEEGRRKYS